MPNLPRYLPLADCRVGQVIPFEANHHALRVNGLFAPTEGTPPFTRWLKGENTCKPRGIFPSCAAGELTLVGPANPQ